MIKNQWQDDNETDSSTPTKCKALSNWNLVTAIRKRLIREADTNSKIELSSFNRDGLILTIITTVEYCSKLAQNFFRDLI